MKLLTAGICICFLPVAFVLGLQIYDSITGSNFILAIASYKPIFDGMITLGIVVMLLGGVFWGIGLNSGRRKH